MLKSRAGLKVCNKRVSQGTRDLNELKNQSPWRDKGRKTTQRDRLLSEKARISEVNCSGY